MTKSRVKEYPLSPVSKAPDMSVGYGSSARECILNER